GDGHVLRMAPHARREHLVARRKATHGLTHRYHIACELPSEDGFAWAEDAEPKSHQDRKSPRHPGAPQAGVARGDRGRPNFDEHFGGLDGGPGHLRDLDHVGRTVTTISRSSHARAIGVHESHILIPRNLSSSEAEPWLYDWTGARPRGIFAGIH